MRNSGLIVLFMALTFSGLHIAAQDGTIKADAEASKAASKVARLPSTNNEASSTSAIVMEKNVFTRSEPVVLARWNGGELTNIEVSSTLAAARPPDLRTVGPEQFSMLSRKQQIETIKDLAWERVLLQQARDAGINETSPEVANTVAAQEESLLNRLYYQQEIMPRLDEMTVEAARSYYDDNKDRLFTKPALTVIRALHVSTYEMVTAEEGDTLSEIAEAVSGDAANAALIREATPPFYLRQAPIELEDDVLSSPLKGGEVLFVPRNAEGISSATAFAKTLRDQIANGKSMDEIVAETKDSDFQVTATEPIRFLAEAGFWDELTAAAANLKETSISQVIKTPAGLDIIALQDAMTTEVIAFADVQDQLIGQVTNDETQRRQTVEKTREETLTRLWKKYGVTVNEEAVGRPNYQTPDLLSTTTAIASAGEFKYTLSQFINDLRMTGKDWGQLTKEQRMDVVRVAPSLTNYLTSNEARALGLDKNPEFTRMIKSITESEIVSLYRKGIQKPEDKRVTDDELRAYYNDHLDNYTSPAQVTIRELSKRINMTLPPAAKAEAVEEARNSLTEIRSRIKNEEDFAQLARRESEAISTRSRGGLIGTVSEDFRGAAFKNQLRQVKEGEVSEPFLYGSEVMIIRLDNRLAPTVQPFEEVRRLVIQEYARTVPPAMKNEEREQALEKANFKIIF